MGYLRPVLFLVFGSTAAGKTFALHALGERRPELSVHDFDDIGVPDRADTAWRQRATEDWVRQIVDYQAARVDAVLAGQTPLGELLAAPSAPLLDCIAACLLDCDDETRIARLRARGPEWLARSPGSLQDHLNWAAWMRQHAEDPQWEPDVIRQAGWTEMRWDRWRTWKAGDPRWRVAVLDTSQLARDGVADALAVWIDRENALCVAGTHPRSGSALSS